jgi:hypothetical protein
MPLNIRLAVWIVNLLCPRLGRHQPPPQAPDFVDDRPVTFCGFSVPVDPDLLTDDELSDGDLAEWAEYSARQHTSIHHLNRCLRK